MKCRFYLLDINEDRWKNKPSVRLWGLDERGKRVLIVATQIMPYFYLLLNEHEDLVPIQEQLLKEKAAFPMLTDISIETEKYLGKARKVLRITCADSKVASKYVRDIRKLLRKGESFEDDLRLSVRYVTDLMLTPCGWHECEVEAYELGGVSVDHSYLAKTPPRSIKDDNVPRMPMLAFNLLTVSKKGSAKAEKDHIQAINVATDSGKSESFVSDGQDDSKTVKDFVAFVRDFDPDIIVGFESNRLDWPYLIQRCKIKKVKLAVGKDGSAPHTSVFGHVSVTGRASLDVSDVAGSIPEVKMKTLENIAKYLQVPSASKLVTVQEAERYSLWIDESGRKKLIQLARMNAQASLEIAQTTMNFVAQLSALTGLPLDQVMTAAVGFRVDSYLIREAHLIGELIPPRNEQPYFTYRGAIVLEPKTGVHDNVVVLDFASMYPNLMKQYNLSPDTLVRPGEEVPEDSVFVIPEVKHRFRKTPDGFYRVVLSALINQRLGIRGEMEKLGERSTKYRLLRDRERAVKLITNACYGYAGWAGARWYVREIAESATALGRMTITKTMEKAESLGLKIIYGDTDSIFVSNDQEKVRKLVDWAQEELDLEVRPEREYVRVLFTEAMKRYAGLLPDGSLDIVGLEVIRSDWSDIARQVQEKVLESILRDQSTEEAVGRVRATIRTLKEGKVPIADLTIWKTLTKPIEDYAVRAPHVEVAKKLLKDGWSLTLGDKVAYVITKGPGKLFQKAQPSGQVRAEDVDIDYYLENQVKPAAMRILERFGVNEKQLIA
jgi:DNA polymerase I